MKTKFLWFINVLLALTALYLAYKIWFAPRKDAWSFIPDNAFVIVESSQIQESLFNNKNKDANQLSDIPFFYDAVQQLKTITQVVDNQAISNKFLSKKLISYSLHRESKKNLEYIIYIPANNFGDADFLNKLILPDQEKRKIYARTYKSTKLYELFENSGKSILNFFIHDDFLISSTSKILLEEVVNRIKSGVSIERVPFEKSRKGSAHIYFKSRSLQDIADILPSQLSPNLIDFFGNITPRNPDIIFEKAKSEHTISAYFHSSGSSNVPFLGIFGKQNPKPITCTDLIPEKTAIMLRMSFHNHLRFAQDLTAYMKANNSSLIADKDSVNRLLNTNLNGFYGILKDEIVLCEMETQADEPAKKILLLKTQDSAEAMNLLDDFAGRAEAFSSYFKTKPQSYLNYFIRKVEISQLPALLFGSTFRGFAECFYTQKDDYIILASDEDAMTQYLSNLNQGQTWSKSVIYTDYLKKLRPEAQVTAIISPQRIWNNLYFSLPTKWKNTMAKHEPRAKNIRFIGVENFVRNTNFGTKIIIEKQPKSREITNNKLFLQDSLSMLGGFRTPPFLIKNPINKGADEIIIQKPDNQVVLLNNHAKIINEIPLEYPILGNYFLPVDYQQDGYIHSFGISSSNAFVFSRDLISGLIKTEIPFPIQGGIRAFTNTQTKIFIVDGSNQIFVLNQETKAIKQIKTPSVLKESFRIQAAKYRNNDYVVLIQKDGTLGVHYENGAYLKGFPKVPLVARPVEMIVETGNGQNSIITLVSEVGEIKKIDMNGNTIESLQIDKTEKKASFEVIFDQDRKNWLVARRTPTDLFIFDKRGASLLKIENTNFQKSELKYFDLGNDIRVLAVFDGKNNTIFDLKGNTVGDKPLPATSLPAISYSETYHKLFVYNPNTTRFEVWSVKL